MPPDHAANLWRQLQPDAAGLVPCVAQDVRSRSVLLVLPVNEAALRATIETGYAHYYSAARGQIWKKGAGSGNRQRLSAIRVDCDRDVVLFVVDPAGPACHEGTDSCFSARRDGGLWRHDPQRILDAPAVKKRTYLGDLERLLDTLLAHDGARKDLRAAVAGGPPVLGAAVKQDAEALAHALLSEDRAAVADVAANLIEHVAVALRTRGVGFDEVLASLHFSGPTTDQKE